MNFFGVIYVITSSCVLLFKKEVSNVDSKAPEQTVKNEDLTVIESYKVAWKIICLKPIHKLIFIIFTLRVIFQSF